MASVKALTRFGADPNCLATAILDKQNNKNKNTKIFKGIINANLPMTGRVSPGIKSVLCGPLRSGETEKSHLHLFRLAKTISAPEGKSALPCATLQGCFQAEMTCLTSKVLMLDVCSTTSKKNPQTFKGIINTYLPIKGRVSGQISHVWTIEE